MGRSVGAAAAHVVLDVYRVSDGEGDTRARMIQAVRLELSRPLPWSCPGHICGGVCGVSGPDSRLLFYKPLRLP